MHHRYDMFNATDATMLEVNPLAETADGRRPTTPPAGASGAAPFFEDTRLTHP